jgi:hypothetical protein
LEQRSVQTTFFVGIDPDSRSPVVAERAEGRADGSINANYYGWY